MRPTAQSHKRAAPSDWVQLVCQRADKAGQEMEETLSEEWVRLTDERAQLQEWQDTLLEKTNEAFAQTRVGRTMLHQ
jgi:ElaB/YqjD/DUF883 family membrane-anchored ribosome-binding protein